MGCGCVCVHGVQMCVFVHGMWCVCVHGCGLCVHGVRCVCAWGAVCMSGVRCVHGSQGPHVVCMQAIETMQALRRDTIQPTNQTVQGGHLRVVRDEHRRHQQPRVPRQGGPGPLQALQDRAAAAHVCGEGPGGGHVQLLRAVQEHQAVPAEAAAERVGAGSGFLGSGGGWEGRCDAMRCS